jgi:hypothetical protein
MNVICCTEYGDFVDTREFVGIYVANVIQYIAPNYRFNGLLVISKSMVLRDRGSVPPSTVKMRCRNPLVGTRDSL